jgi:hypothetical protein
VDDHSDFILGPVSPKEYKDTVAELNGSRTKRAFEFFKVTARERLGFAKHREVPERKAAALAAAETDAGETAASPRAGGTLSKKTTKKTTLAAAATVTTEGKARKKRGARPIGSPPTAKRTRFVDVETGVVGTVIAVVLLRSAAPSGGGGGDVGGPLLVPLTHRRKTMMKRAMFASCPQLAKLLVAEAPNPRSRSPLRRRQIKLGVHQLVKFIISTHWPVHLSFNDGRRKR